MQVSSGSEAVWHNDGHKITVTLDRAEVVVKAVPCHYGGEAPCRHPAVGCVVEHFVRLFGLECNVGVAPAEPVMEVAWALFGDPYDIDACQLWTIFLDDPVYASWVEAQGT